MGIVGRSLVRLLVSSNRSEELKSRLGYLVLIARSVSRRDGVGMLMVEVSTPMVLFLEGVT